MEHPLQEHYERVTALLQPLRPILQAEADSLFAFDEFLAQNELELALHVACDFLLSHQGIPINRDTLTAIESAHAAMDIEDDCLLKLQRKCRQRPEALIAPIAEFAAMRNPMGYAEEDVPRLIKEWRAEDDAKVDRESNKTG